MINLEGSMSNGNTAGWVCPTFVSVELSLSTRRSCERERAVRD